MKKAVMCIGTNQTQAESIVAQLQVSGFSGNDISVVMRDTTAKGHESKTPASFGHAPATRSTDGAPPAGKSRDLVGGAIGMLGTIGGVNVPRVGAVIAAGPLRTALQPSGGSADVGAGLAGVLMGLGIPDPEAKAYETHIKAGNILVAVHTENPEQQRRAEQILRTARAEDICVPTESGVSKRVQI